MRRRSILLVGVVAATVAALGLVLSGCAARSEGAGATASRGALAVVLAPTTAGTRLVVVDLEGFRVVRTIGLRSLVTDIDLDAARGRVVAAQTGGIGDKADRAVALADPLSGQVRYVTLDVPDPVNVVCEGGIAYVLHSVVTTGGLVCSVVDVGRERLLKTTRVPDGPGIWASSRRGIWTVRAGDDEWTAVLLGRSDLGVSTVASTGVRVSGVAETATGTVLLGALVDEPGRAAATLVDDSGVAARAIALPDLRYPARIGALVGSRLVVGDWAGQIPEPVELAVLDAATMQRQRSVRVPGVPCALAANEASLLVVERSTGRLSEIDPASGDTLRSVSLGTGELLVSDIVVVPGLAAGNAR